MQTKALFLLKVFGCSLPLFLGWPFIARGHAALVDLLLRLFDPRYRQLTVPPEVFYYGSMPLILLISLLVATPRLGNRRRAGLVGLGIAAFMLLDFMRIRLEIVPTRSAGWLAYEGLKVVLPFFIWFIGAASHLGEIFQPAPAALSPGPAGGYVCPLCGQTHADLRAHLQEVHGRQSLRIKKVKRLLATLPAKPSS